MSERSIASEWIDRSSHPAEMLLHIESSNG
jgi:hypothetical protein